MAKGKLHYCGHVNTVMQISNALTAYVLLHNAPPAVIRTPAATFAGNAPADIRGVRVIVDNSVQPEHFMLCAEEDGE